MNPSEPTPVKLLCGILYSAAELLEQAKLLLEKKYGVIDFTSQIFSFDLTDYYDPEMGTPIYRLFYSFEKLINPKELAQIKIDCNNLEDELAVNGNRKVNIDAGYMDYHKVVLASAKYEGHKIYMDLGIYADTTLTYGKGRFVPTPVCFPDFKDGRYEKTFLLIRERYKASLKQNH